jgi:hypothetical protein
MSKLTVGYLRDLMKDLPDDMEITECDYDESNLSCTPEQFVIDSQFLMFVPNKCYEAWNQYGELEEINKPIPKEWK